MERFSYEIFVFDLQCNLKKTLILFYLLESELVVFCQQTNVRNLKVFDSITEYSTSILTFFQLAKYASVVSIQVW